MGAEVPHGVRCRKLGLLKRPNRKGRRNQSTKAGLPGRAAISTAGRRGRVRRVLILGPGRLGGALALALRRAGHSVWLLGRAGPELRHGLRRTSAPPLAPADADCILLTVPDQAIAEVTRARQAQFHRGQVVAHCSGALGLEVLAPAAERGAHVGSLHPLCAVPSSSASLTGAFAAIEGDPTASRMLTRLARDAGLTSFRLPPGRRALYHAAAAMASNGLVALADEATALLGACGLPRRGALQALGPLMRSALAGLEREGLPRALTGPIARGDAAVVEAHLQALAKSPSPTAPLLYRALALALVRVSGELGRAREDDLSRVLEALVSPERPEEGRGSRRRRAPRGQPAPRRPRSAPTSRG
jgi:predicted short-subunit dehydrogenase-like oxidoreductase (DUF2520 family)